MLAQHINKAELEAYLATRDTIDKEINQLLLFTSLLRQYKDCSGDEVLVEMTVIGEVNDRMHNQLHNITEALDGFLPLWEVVKVLNEG